jgi:hypothetical protein
MDLLIDVNKGNIEISLRKKGRIIDSLSFPDMHNLTEELLPGIDQLLKRNKLDIFDVVRSQVNSDQSDSFTTTRIARVVADVITHMKIQK